MVLLLLVVIAVPREELLANDVLLREHQSYLRCHLFNSN